MLYWESQPGKLPGMKYPRTPHLPWSPGAAEDDLHCDGSQFEGKLVVVTEKLDGENTTMTRERVHARSLDSGYHPSRTRVSALHGQISWLIEEGVRLCGENLQAIHSVEYTHVPGPFIVYSAWVLDTCLSWDMTCDLAERMNLPVAPVIYRGTYKEREIRDLWKSVFKGRSAYGPVAEGYVLRTVGPFKYEDFGTNVAKWVRPNHVQTDQHWAHGPMKENGGL